MKDPKIICDGKFSIDSNGVLIFSTLWQDVRVKGIHCFGNQLIALVN